MKRLFFILFLIVPLTIACVGSGPHAFLDNSNTSPENPSGTPTGTPEPISLPQAENLLGTGATTRYQSERASGFGITSFIQGGVSQGQKYRMISPSIRFAQQRLQKEGNP